MRQVNHYAYGIKLKQVDYFLNLRTLQETKIEISLRSEAYCSSILGFFREFIPHIVLGYSDQLLSLYDNHFQEFCELSRQKAAAADQPR